MRCGWVECRLRLGGPGGEHRVEERQPDGHARGAEKGAAVESA